MKTLIVLLGLVYPMMASASISTFICDYSRYSNPEDSHQAEEHFSFTFILDEAKNTAYVLGSQGSSEVTVVNDMKNITFSEATDAGNVMRITVASIGQSANSRNQMPGMATAASPPVVNASTSKAPGRVLHMGGRCSAVGS